MEETFKGYPIYKIADGVLEISESDVEGMADAFNLSDLIEYSDFNYIIANAALFKIENDEKCIKDENINKCLDSACASGLYLIVEAMIDKKVDITLNDNRCLSVASSNNEEDIVHLLLENGAKVSESDAIYKANRYSHEGMVDVLVPILFKELDEMDISNEEKAKKFTKELEDIYTEEEIEKIIKENL